MRHYDGSRKVAKDLFRFQEWGYTLLLALTYGEEIPESAQFLLDMENGKKKGYALKNWAFENGYYNHIVYRNTGYQKDLHGIVYELYVTEKLYFPPMPSKWLNRKMGTRRVIDRTFGGMVVYRQGLSNTEYQCTLKEWAKFEYHAKRIDFEGDL